MSKSERPRSSRRFRVFKVPILLLKWLRPLSWAKWSMSNLASMLRLRRDLFLEPLPGAFRPAPFGMASADGDHSIIGEPMIVDRLAVPFRRFTADRVEQPVGLVQIDVRRQRAERASWWDPDLSASLEDLLDEVHELWVLDPPGGGAKVRLEDSFRDQLQCPLRHAAADTRNLERSDVAVALRDLHLAVWHGFVPACDEALPDRRQKHRPPRGLDVPELLATGPGDAAVSSGDSVSLLKGPGLRDVHEQTPETMRRFRLRLSTDPPSQFLEVAGRLCPLTPASP